MERKKLSKQSETVKNVKPQSKMVYMVKNGPKCQNWSTTVKKPVNYGQKRKKKMVKMVKNGQKQSQMVKNGQNCPKWSKTFKNI